MLVTIDCPHALVLCPPRVGRRIHAIYCVPDPLPEPKLGLRCRSVSASASSRQLRTPRQISSHKPTYRYSYRAWLPNVEAGTASSIFDVLLLRRRSLVTPD